ncbi:MAG: hypothetical protein ACC645_17795, partial [Pirellulales bacterium]
MATNIATAINDQVTLRDLKDLKPANLGSGLIHVADRPKNTVSLPVGSTLAFREQLPVSIQAVGAGLAVQVPRQRIVPPIGGASDMVEGDTFVIDDGVNTPLTFEFDIIGNGVGFRHRTIDLSDISATTDPARVTDRMESAVQLAVTDGALAASLAISNLGVDGLQMDSADVRIESATGAATHDRRIDEDDSFEISDGTITVRFIFDSDNSVTEDATTRRVVFTSNSTPDEIAAAIRDAVLGATSLTGMNPVTLGDGIVQLGETTDAHS